MFPEFSLMFGCVCTSAPISRWGKPLWWQLDWAPRKTLVFIFASCIFPFRDRTLRITKAKLGPVNWQILVCSQSALAAIDFPVFVLPEFDLKGRKKLTAFKGWLGMPWETEFNRTSVQPSTFQNNFCEKLSESCLIVSTLSLSARVLREPVL